MCFLAVCIAKQWFGRIVGLGRSKGVHGQGRHLALVIRMDPRGRWRSSLEWKWGVKGRGSILSRHVDRVAGM